MAQSPKFLSAYRRVSTQPTLRQQSRTFVSSMSRASSGGKLSTDASVKTDQYPDDEHATNKKDKLDVQSDSSAKGREAKARDDGGHATQEKDAGSTQRAKQEHPEAPDVVIGMQDERGGKGN